MGLGAAALRHRVPIVYCNLVGGSDSLIFDGGSLVIVSGKKANLALYGNSATVAIKNTKFSGSGGYGIYAGYGSTLNADAATVNTIEANALDSVYREK